MVGAPFEGSTPTRRYKYFRPRQAMRGRIELAIANFATLSLYNNSTAAHLLVVRNFVAGNGNGFGPTGIGTFSFPGTLGTQGGLTARMLPGDAQLPGQMFSLDDAVDRSALFDNMPVMVGAPGDFMMGWFNDFPFAVLQPNWSFCVQLQQAHPSFLSVVYEAIYEDELDWMY